MPIYKSSNASIYYEIHGSGPVLFMVAGMSSDSKSWQFILDRMVKDYRLVIFDNRGCGRTKTDGSSFDLKDLAKDALGLMEYLEYERVHLIGHSMGGMIAQEMALMQPDRIDKLVLASSSPQLSEKARNILDELYNKWVDGYDLADWFRIMFKWLFTEKALANKKLMDAAIIYALTYPYSQTLDGFKSQVDAISSFNAVDRINDIHHNTLVLSGKQDKLITPEESRALLQISGPCDFKIIDDAAHSIHAEHPGEFVNAVVDFLRKK